MFPRVLIALAIATASAAGQVPGTPVLQNAFANPGLAVAANFGSGSGTSFFGAAAAWGMGSGKLQLSGAAGAQRGHGSTRGAYGARVAAALWSASGGSLGVSGFAGVGGAPRSDSAGILSNPATMTIPVGGSVGYRRAMGSSRGMSVYAAPFYRWSRVDNGTTVTSTGDVRVSLGLDFAFSTSLGLTVGTELGQSGGGKSSTSSTFGGGVTFVPGRR